jgi:hypothetical protein
MAEFKTGFSFPNWNWMSNNKKEEIQTYKKQEVGKM